MAVKERHSHRPPLGVQVGRECAEGLRRVAKPVQEQHTFRVAIQRDGFRARQQLHLVGRGFIAAAVPGAEHPAGDDERRNRGEAA